MRISVGQTQGCWRWWRCYYAFSDPMPKIKWLTTKELERKFTVEGFKTYETVLGADGVGVLWPAIFRNGDGDMISPGA